MSLKPTVIRQKRKTLMLQITPLGEIVIKAPLQITDAKIVEFVTAKKRWIVKKLADVETKQTRANELELDEETLLKVKNVSRSQLTQETEKWGELMVHQLPTLPTKISTTQATSLWGSCNSRNEIKLNWRLMLVPSECREYVIIHELAHIKHKNHQAEFWKLVEQFCPNYKQVRQKLQEYAYLLTKFK
jgi:predicted metal-dependent hydrolase